MEKEKRTETSPLHNQYEIITESSPGFTRVISCETTLDEVPIEMK